MILNEILSIESRISEIETELESNISDSAKDSLYLELFKLEDRMGRLYGDKEEFYSGYIEDD